MWIHLKNFLFVILGLVLISFIANFLLDNPYSQRVIKNLIEKNINDKSDIKIQYEVLDLHVLPLSVEIYGLKIESSKSDSHEIQLSVPHLKFRLSLLDIFIGKITGAELSITNPQGYAKILIDLDEKSKKEGLIWPLFDFYIKHIRILNARTKLDFILSQDSAPKQTWAIFAHSSDIDVYFKNWEQFTGNMSSKSLHISNNSQDLITKHDVSSKFSLKNNIFKTEEFLIKGKNTLVQGETNATVFHSNKSLHKIAGISLKSSIKANVDLSLLGVFLNLEKTHGASEGFYSINSYIPFDKAESKFLLKGKARIHDGYLADIRLFDSQAVFNINKDRIAFEKLEVIKDKNKLAKVSGKIEFNKKVNFKFIGELTGLKLSHIMSAFDSPFKTIDFDAHTSNLLIQGQGDPYLMDLKARGELSQVAFPELGSKGDNPACRMDFDLKIDEHSLDFGQSQGICFTPPHHYVPGPPHPDQEISAPSKAQNISKLSLSKRIDFDLGPDMLIESSSLNLGLVHSFLGLRLAGMGTTHTHIIQKKNRVFIDNKIKIKQLAWDEVALGDMSAEATYVEDILSWNNVLISEKQHSLLESNVGSYDFKNNHFSVQAQAQDVPSSMIEKIFTQIFQTAPVEFEIHKLKLNLSGKTNDFIHSKGSFNTRISQLKIKHEKIADSLSLDLDSSTHGLHLNPAVLTLGTFVMQIKANQVKHPKKGPSETHISPLLSSLGLTREDHLDIQIEGKDSDSSQLNLQKFPFLAELSKKAQCDGSLNFVGQIHGSAAQLQGSFTAQIERMMINNTSFGMIEFKGFFAKKELEIFVEHAGKTLQGRMLFSFSKNTPYEWFISTHNLDIRALFPEEFAKDPRNFAYLSAEWKFKGLLTQWWQSLGHFSLNQFVVQYIHETDRRFPQFYTLENTEPSTLVFSKEGLFFQDNKPLAFKSPHLSTSIDIHDSKLPNRLHLQIQNILDLSVFPKISPLVESATGKLNIVNSISGSLDNLSVDSHIFHSVPEPGQEKAPISINAPKIGPAFQDILVDINYKNSTLVIHELSAQKGRGSIKGMGGIEFGEHSINKDNIVVTLDNVSLNYPVPYLRSLDTLLKGKIILSGHKFPFMIAGDIEIIKARSTGKFTLSNEFLNYYRTKSIDYLIDGEQTEPMVEFDLKVKADRSISTDDPDFRFLVSTNLSLTGNNIKPRIIGRVLIDEGQFKYKREFKVTRGEVLFDGNPKNDAILDFIANAEIAPYNLTTIISGTTASPQINIIVDPSTKEDGTVISQLDSIVLLSTGKLPVNNSQFDQTTNIGVAAAINIYASQIPFEKLNDLTGQSFISPSVNTTLDTNGTIVPQVNFPIKITDILDVTVHRTPSSTQISAELPIYENIAFSGSATSQTSDELSQGENKNQINLKFHFSFD